MFLQPLKKAGGDSGVFNAISVGLAFWLCRNFGDEKFYRNFSQPLCYEALSGLEEKQKLRLLNAENFLGLSNANKLLFQRRSEGLLRCHKLLGAERIRGFRFGAACTRTLLCHAGFKAFL